MKRYGMYYFSLAVLACCLTVLPPGVFGQEHGSHVGAGPEPSHHGGNPLREEMEKLDQVFRDVVSGVALGDGARVHEALEQMHGTMEHTHEGMREGSVKLGKNADRAKEFVAWDRQFHARLEHLAAAAHANDQQSMLKLTKELLDRCVECHRTFRGR